MRGNRLPQTPYLRPRGQSDARSISNRIVIDSLYYDKVLNRRLLLLAPALLALPRLRASTSPKQILLIRHAEKSANKTDPNLSPRGLERAAALPKLFPARFDTPGFIFATAPAKHSNRPIETVTPVSRALHVAINSRYTEASFASLARDVLGNPNYANATILISWRHNDLPALATALKATNHPSRWPDTQFDRVWKISYLADQATFADLPQRLLPGDSE